VCACGHRGLLSPCCFCRRAVPASSGGRVLGSVGSLWASVGGSGGLWPVGLVLRRWWRRPWASGLGGRSGLSRVAGCAPLGPALPRVTYFTSSVLVSGRLFVGGLLVLGLASVVVPWLLSSSSCLRSLLAPSTGGFGSTCAGRAQLVGGSGVGSWALWLRAAATER